MHGFFRSPPKNGQTFNELACRTDIGDRELAEKLAEQDRIDFETTKLEDSWKKVGAQTGNNAYDAIQVDADETSTTPVAESSLASSSRIVTTERPTTQPSISKLPSSIDITSQPATFTLPHYAQLSVDPITFDMNEGPPWPPLSPTPYSFLTHVFTTLSQTRSRIQILNILTNCLRLIYLSHPQSLLPALYLLSNSLSPAYSPVELGLGPSVISKALQQVSGLTPAALSKLYKSLGDPGDVAFAAKSSVRTLIPHPALSIMGVYDSLLKISRAQGQGAARLKQSLVERLLISAKGEESRYLVRTLFQNLRVGAVRTTILSALARALVLTSPVNPTSMRSIFYASPELLSRARSLPTEGKKKSGADPARHEIMELFGNAEALIKCCFVQHPNLNDMTAALIEVGMEGLADRVPLTVGACSGQRMANSTISNVTFRHSPSPNLGLSNAVTG